MNHQHNLSGGCSCGRNRYIVHIPSDSRQAAQVIFDNSSAHRRSQATPLSAWLRVPLTWYQSTTYAFMDDETHNSIRRSYTSPVEQDSKRHFCGFCGTPLSYWSESSPEEAEYISLTLGSLAGKYLRDLEELGLLPKDALEELEDEEALNNGATQVQLQEETKEGLPWFETMIDGSQLGRIRKTWGQRSGANGRYKVEWEIVEWTESDDSDVPLTPGKRKIGELIEDEEMHH